MNFRLLSLLILTTFLVGCSDEKKAESIPTKNPVISTLTGGTLRLKTTDITQIFESSVIYANDGSIIPDNVPFRIVSDTVLISDDNNSFLNEIVVLTEDGRFQFYVQPYTVTGLYRIYAYPIANDSIKFDQGINARYFVDISSGTPFSLGQLRTDQFEDLDPYNGQRDANEAWIINSNPDLSAYISVGPVMDQFNNLVNEGTISLSVDQGLIISENPSRVLGGYAYFTYRPDGSVGDFNATATINHSSNVNLSRSQSLKKASPSINFLDLGDFSGMQIGESRCLSLRLQNQGSMPGVFLDLMSVFPYNILPNTLDDPLCPQTSDLCLDRQTLKSQEICRVRIKYTQPSGVVSDGELTARVSPQEFASSTAILPLRTQVVQAAQLSASNSFISFGATQCSSERTIDIFIRNDGDFDAENISVQNPPPNTNQSSPFFSLILPPANPSPSPNINDVIDCGTTFPARRKCRVQVRFNPTASIQNQALTARINGSNVSPVLITVSGYTIPGNPLNTFPITFQTPNNSILPLGMNIQNGQRTTVSVGPIVDACSSPVTDGTIVNASVTGGFLSAQTVVTNNGVAQFTWNALSDINLLGTQTINISTSAGSKTANLEFRGIRLELSGPASLGQVVEGRPRNFNYVLTNTGTLNAQGITINTADPLIVLDRGACADGVLEINESCQILVQAAPQGVNADLNSSIIASSTSPGLNVVSLAVTVNARTRPILTFDRNRYLFNNGQNQANYIQIVTLTNTSPAISYNTQILADYPFVVQFSDCPQTLNPLASCSAQIRLSAAEIGNSGGDKRVYVVNEVDTGVPSAQLSFSELKFTNSQINGITNLCHGPFNLSISGVNETIVNASNNTIISLFDSNTNALFYPTNTCDVGTSISQVTIPTSQNVSSNFYIRSSQIGEFTISAVNDNIAGTSQNYFITNPIDMNVTIPRVVSFMLVPLNLSGGYPPYTVTFANNSTSNAYGIIGPELDSSTGNPTGQFLLEVQEILTPVTVTVKITDSLGYMHQEDVELFPITYTPTYSAYSPPIPAPNSLIACDGTVTSLRTISDCVRDHDQVSVSSSFCSDPFPSVITQSPAGTRNVAISNGTQTISCPIGQTTGSPTGVSCNSGFNPSPSFTCVDATPSDELWSYFTGTWNSAVMSSVTYRIPPTGQQTLRTIQGIDPLTMTLSIRSYGNRSAPAGSCGGGSTSQSVGFGGTVTSSSWQNGTYNPTTQEYEYQIPFNQGYHIRIGSSSSSCSCPFGQSSYNLSCSYSFTMKLLFNGQQIDSTKSFSLGSSTVFCSCLGGF